MSICNNRVRLQNWLPNQPSVKTDFGQMQQLFMIESRQRLVQLTGEGDL